MNFYYDILVNLQEEFYEFYEWEKDDIILAIKKTPLFRVNHQVILDFLTYDIQISDDVSKSVLGKTICKNHKEKLNGFLVSDTKTSLFVEINDDGKVIFKSKLLVSDENDVNEIVNALKETDLGYQVGNKWLKNNTLRRTIREQKLIMAILNDLMKNKDVDKCNYLYYELFHELVIDYDKAIVKMQRYIYKGDVLKVHKLAKLLNLAYQERL